MAHRATTRTVAATAFALGALTLLGGGIAGAAPASTPQSVQASDPVFSSTVTLSPVTGAKIGTAIALKAKITPAAADGTVEFKDGTTVLGTAQVGNDGTATHQWTPTTNGKHTITATYRDKNGDEDGTTTATVTVGDTNPGGLGSLGSLLGFGS
ncbi:Ig-like domain-containing protein [Rhodococcus sp. UNC363MFTsu5.1]|uniref:Ig-like domain-containing protein n=1 Tax=Rhodococcus sp. UNC363MFTsu5.1 TaxID=1449069 RepID=UPI000489317A|nr:Ig-like domain-containing protein [Rhodococcus sp. UNC363MFTsu5.1]